MSEGHKVQIGIKWATPYQLPVDKQSVTKIQDELQVNQSLEASVRLVASPEDLLTSGAEPFITQLLKGISVDIKFHVWRKIADVILKLIESGDVDPSLYPIFGGIAPVFLLKLNAQLNIEVDDYMKEKIQTNPLIEPLLMDALSLINATSAVSSDEESEYDEFLNSAVPPPVAMILRAVQDHLGDEIDVEAITHNLGLIVRLQGKGLALLVKNASKYIK